MATNQDYFDAVLALKQARIAHDAAILAVATAQTALNLAQKDAEIKFRTMEDNINVGTNPEQKTRAVDYGKAVRVEYNARNTYTDALAARDSANATLQAARTNVIKIANELASDPA